MQPTVPRCFSSIGWVGYGAKNIFRMKNGALLLYQVVTIGFVYIMKYSWPRYYNKNKWVSDHSVEIMHVKCFCVGIFHESAGLVKYPYQNNENDIHKWFSELVLVFMPYYYWFYIDFNGLCVHFKMFSGVTAISCNNI